MPDILENELLSICDSSTTGWPSEFEKLYFGLTLDYFGLTLGYFGMTLGHFELTLGYFGLV